MYASPKPTHRSPAISGVTSTSWASPASIAHYGRPLNYSDSNFVLCLAGEHLLRLLQYHDSLRLDGKSSLRLPELEPRCPRRKDSSISIPLSTGALLSSLIPV
ncbi:hypothetical protein QCA50_019764 [Cerrena zonata]|uniref:Uncharacterized protein n=1 Tax=Cerrena zonata TaxID=2478898 RepID=A0AAW0FA29_9APHY